MAWRRSWDFIGVTAHTTFACETVRSPSVSKCWALLVCEHHRRSARASRHYGETIACILLVWLPPATGNVESEMRSARRNFRRLILIRGVEPRLRRCFGAALERFRYALPPDLCLPVPRSASLPSACSSNVLHLSTRLLSFKEGGPASCSRCTSRCERVLAATALRVSALACRASPSNSYLFFFRSRCPLSRDSGQGRMADS